MDVRIASENDKEKWNQFVDREDGSYYHYFDWKYVYEFTGSKHRFIPLIIENNSSEIVGIFPTREILTLLYGSLLSLPLVASNDFLIKKKSSDEGEKIIIQSFLDYIDAHYSDSHSSLVLREHHPLYELSTNPSQMLIENGFTGSYNASMKMPCNHVMPLEKPFKEKIFKSMVKNLRNRIRHSKKIGAEVILDEDLKYKDDFIEMQIQIAKKFGVVEDKEMLNRKIRIFHDKMKLFVCLVDSEPVSALLNYYTPTTAYAAIGAYNLKAKGYLNSTLPMCASIRYACDKGYQHFDMGITSTETLAAYKEKFGAKRIPLMIYQKEFSHFKVITNKASSYITGFGRKYIINQ